MEAFSGTDRRRRNLQVVLFLIILATLPFYAAGIFLLLTAPSQSAIPTAQPTTPAAITRVLATNTRISVPTVSGGGLAPTPGQYIPPIVVPTSNIVFPTAFVPTATFFIFPTSTIAPSLTPFPTDPPPAPTNTPLPLPTDTAIPLPPTDPPSPVPDSDGDGVADNLDLCPGVVGVAPDGCPPPTP